MSDLETIYTKVLNENINPEPKSGRKERLENLVNRYIYIYFFLIKVSIRKP